VGGALQKQDLGAAQKRQDMWMIVGFEVMPCSVKREYPARIKPVECNPWTDGLDKNPQPQPIRKGADIVYSYDVLWEDSNIEWASRWDAYLRMSDGSVHWFSILNSMLVVLVMSVIVAVILMRTVRRDLARYEELLIEGPEAKEEFGWKLVSGDVFRTPPSVQGLAVHVCFIRCCCCMF
jgi:transmembrane 9 superfamily member 2/4